MATPAATPDAPGPSFSVTLDDDGSRYVARSDDGLEMGYLAFTVTGGVSAMTSTHTDPSYRGRGVARALVVRALDDARANGWLVDPRCWYVAQFIDRNREYAGLLSPDASTPEPPVCELPATPTGG